MPAQALKGLEKKSSKSLKEIEKYWKKAKKIALKKFNKTDKEFYPYAMGITKRMVGASKLKSIVKSALFRLEKTNV